MNQVNPFYNRNYTCPVCQKKFTSLSVRSSAIYLEKRESDFHCTYRNISPLHYSIIVCPACKYAASNNLFAKELPLTIVEQLALALAQLPSNDTDFSKERDLDMVLETFKMAIRTSQLKKSEPGELAGLLLAAAWICREANHEELENTYLAEALKYYLQAFEKSSSHIGNLTDIQAAYLIGELHLRRGNYNEAVNWFNRTIVHPKIKTNPAIEKQARDQWQVARELAHQQKAAGTAVQPNQTKSAQDHVTADNHSKNDINKTKEPSPTGNSSPPARNRSTMQIMANLYNDQIDWLNQIVNRGYDHSKHLVNKEQVLRSLLDACQEYLEGEIPTQFSSETELKTVWLELLSSKNS
ncbi:Zinc finger, RING/FYVE/PHD-type [Syntrophomonas zehnderi OL-4]|uniref:Zinc finger, RING/FYVE/PHD-type n=1 Tax=Syntrophomonas zehnderi OL-4 TaxID=690567 RepID=A0A0E4C7C8_9FIRM|nr:DUF2225 domain-containing protein [Syntrophomonas zehnderi]CFW97246.1 Zinc finger, RING/FYVE/PHD-type [Syntrophomonas zehnderi OL-4]